MPTTVSLNPVLPVLLYLVCTIHIILLSNYFITNIILLCFLKINTKESVTPMNWETSFIHCTREKINE